MTRIIAIICYYTGLDALFYWLNRKAKRIITFHNVLPDAMFRDGVANGVSSRLSDFERIIDECAKRFDFSLDLDDSKTLTITFDDGYANQYTTAFKALQKRGIPAYLFCAGDCLENKILTIDKLTHWIDCVPNGVYDLGLHGQLVIQADNRAEQWECVLWPAFLKDGENFGVSVYEACNLAYPMQSILSSLPSEYVKERLSGVTPEQCDEMRKEGWKIGWHTQHHFPLSGLRTDVALQEMTPPSDMCDVCFSFPYGEDQSVCKANVEQAECLGFPCAVSNTYMSCHNLSAYFRPRMALSVDKYLLHFELSGCKFFLQHKVLLPSCRKDAKNA